MMKLSSIGEFGFIKRIAPPFLHGLPRTVVGIGDDCAVIPRKDGTSLLVTTDMLVENIHFLRSKSTPRDLGYKSLAVNLSDIAAMGGRPESAFISICIPQDIDVEWLDEFYGGVRELAESEGVSILGGDTTKAPAHLVINIAVLGTADSRRIKYRSSALKDDCICVTDFLGDSGGGLNLLLHALPPDDDAQYLIRRHQRPRAQIPEGSWLAAQEGVHAMMDVSDGIDSDLHRIMESSSCGVRVHIERLPVSPQLQRISRRYELDVAGTAVSGGEDYCLLTTIAPGSYAAVAREFENKFGRPLVNIGTIVGKEEGFQYFKHGNRCEMQIHGYDHFT